MRKRLISLVLAALLCAVLPDGAWALDNASGQAQVEETAGGTVCALLRQLARWLGFAAGRDVGPGTQVQVASLEDFFNAVDSDTEITLAPGVYDLSKLRLEELDNPYVAVDYEVFDLRTGTWNGGDCWQIVVRQVHDLTVNAAGVTFSTPWAYADVLRFEDCQRVRLNGAVAVHDVAPGYCTGNCLELVNCEDFRAVDCTLDGSGAYGLYAEGCRDVAVEGGEIAHCTYGAAVLGNCEDVVLSGCRIHGCKDCFNLLGSNNCQRVSVKNCTVEDNTASVLWVSDGEVSFVDCTFRGNQFVENGVEFLRCTWEE